MRKPLLNALRQMCLQIGSLLGLIVIIGVSVGFYATLKSNSVNFEQSTYHFFREYKMPDLIVDGVGFTEEDAAKLEKIVGVEAVQARATVDARAGDITFRLLSYDIHDPRVNRPYLYEGEEPKTSEECLVADKYALKHNVHPGDTLSFTHRAFSAECKVSGIATTPEDMYLKQSATETIADTSEFGVLYVDTEFLAQRKIPWNQIALVFEQGADESRIKEIVEDELGEKVFKLTTKEKVSSYGSFSADVGDFNRMAHIFPIVFLIIASVVVFVGQRRNVLRDRRQIGILKAMGCSSAQIMYLYCVISVLAMLLGVVFGTVIAYNVGPTLVNTYKGIFSAPFFTSEGLFNHLWLPSILAFLVTIISTLIAVWRVVTIMPAEAMHAEQPKTGRDILLQRTRLWKRLTFHSRYALKSALRNRGRFFAMVCGIVASVMLTVMSLGFQDSYRFITTDYFDTAVDYDFAVRTEPTPSTQPPAFLDAVDLTNQQQALLLSATLTAGDRAEELPVVIVDDPEAVYSFESSDGGQPEYDGGLVLSHYYADKLGVSVGDAVEIATPNGVVEGTIKLSDRVKQNIGFIAIVTYAQAEKHLGLENQSYNTIFANADGNRNEIEKEIERQDGVLAVSSIGDEREGFQKLSATLDVYIQLLVMFSIVLGVAALYSVSTIALLARQYEFVVLRVMGYSPRDISLAYLKELGVQFVTGLPFGLIGGYYLTSVVARQFANAQMLFEAFINWDTYVYSALAALIVIGFVSLISLRKIARLQLVEGLKGRDE